MDRKLGEGESTFWEQQRRTAGVEGRQGRTREREIWILFFPCMMDRFLGKPKK